MDNITVNMKNLSADEREQLMKLIEKANKAEDKAWKPKYCERYYYIRFDGKIDYITWDDTKINNNMYSIGNCFRTEEEAEFSAEKLKVIAEMKRISAKDDEVEWDGYFCHHYINYNVNTRNLDIGTASWTKVDLIYFASKERAQEAIDTIGKDRIKKYLFGIEVE